MSAPPGLIRNVDFLLLTTASAVSHVGTKISGLALPLLVLALTDSPAWAGALGAARLLPYLVFSLIAGAWVDRADRKKLLVTCDLLRFALLGSIPVTYALGALSMLHLLVVLLAEGTCTVLFSLAELSALPRVVHVGEIARARAVHEGIESAAGVLGPSIGGLVIGLGRTTVVGAMFAYLTDSVSYLLSALSLLFVRRRLQEDRREAAGVLSETAEGLRFLWRQRALRRVAALTTLVNFLQAPMLLAVIVLAQSRMGLSAIQLGVVFGVAGAAGVIGSVVAPIVHRHLSFRAITFAATGAWALSALMIAVATSAMVLTAGWALTALLWPVYAVAVVAFRLTVTPDRLQGRVNSAFRTFSFGVEPLGLALGGVLVGMLGAPAVFGLIALGLAGASAVACLVPPERLP
jgi:Na+/melibiose symporter-like transporter